MSFNSTDFSAPPWVNGIMTLTHDECMEVKTACQQIIDEFVPTQEYTSCTDFYVVSTYNKIDWHKSINGDTYEVLKEYNPEINTLGIDANGIVI